jgi:hypothetical protein
MRVGLAIFGLAAILLGTPSDGLGPAAAAPSDGQVMDWAETLALARHGDARAQSLVGSTFARGEGVESDPLEAGEWYGRAAAQGLPEAQYALGVVYSEGRGVYRDLAEAYFWCHLAASQAHPGAAACRDGIAQGLSPLRLSAVKERLRNWRPRPGAVPLEGSTAEAWPYAAPAVSEPAQADPETHDTPNEDDTVSEIENSGNARAGSADSEISVGVPDKQRLLLPQQQTFKWECPLRSGFRPVSPQQQT